MKDVFSSLKPSFLRMAFNSQLKLRFFFFYFYSKKFFSKGTSVKASLKNIIQKWNSLYYRMIIWEPYKNRITFCNIYLCIYRAFKRGKKYKCFCIKKTPCGVGACRVSNKQIESTHLNLSRLFYCQIQK